MTDPAPAMPKRLRPITRIPPGSAARVTPTEITASVPLWTYWARIAQIQADTAEAGRETDAMIDYLSAAVVGTEPEEKPELIDPGQWTELLAGLVAVAAAAHALDGLYGSVAPLAPLKFRRGTKRPRCIHETLKAAFRIPGKAQARWEQEIDWLFEARDDAVHHDEGFQPVMVDRMTEETIVLAAPEVVNYGAPSARRAADLVVEVAHTCLRNPKPTTAAWVARQTDAVMELAGLPPNPPPKDEPPKAG